MEKSKQFYVWIRKIQIVFKGKMIMKKIWKNYLKDAVFLYCVLFTFTTILNSIIYLCDGLYEDPNGNWHELDRAVIVLIGVLAYELIEHIPIKKSIFRIIAAYIPTVLLTLAYVGVTGLREPLAGSAYKDVFICFTGMFIMIGLSVKAVTAIGKKLKDGK